MPLVAVGTLVRMLVGRDEELDRLTSALRHGRSAVIVGPAGIGKSTLAQTAASDLGGAFVGRAIASLSSVPFHLFRNRLRDHPVDASDEVVDHVLRSDPGPIVLDDLQWADPASLEVVDLLVGRVPVVATIRTDEPGSAPASARLEALGFDRFELRGLTDHEARALARRANPALTDTQVQALVDTAAGSPLLLIEMGRHDSVSPTLTRALLARLDDLAPEAREVVHRLCVLGRPAPPDLVGDGVATAVASGLVHWVDDQVEVHHPLLGELIEENLGDEAHTVRRRLAPLVGPHEAALLHARAGDRERARAEALRAVAAAASQRDRTEALLLAISHAPPGELDADLRFEATQLLIDFGRPSEALECSGLHLLDQTDASRFDRGRLTAVAAYSHWLLGDTARFATLVEDALTNLRGTRTEVEVRVLAGSTIYATWVDLDGRSALDRARQAVELSDEIGMGQGFARMRLAAVLSTIGASGWTDLYQEAIDLAERSGDARLGHEAATSLVLAEWTRGDAHLARKVARAQLERTDRVEYPQNWLVHAASAAILDLQLGEDPAVIVERWRPVIEEVQFFRTRPFLEAAVTIALADLGLDHEAERATEGLLERTGVAEQWQAVARWAQAEVAFAGGHDDEVLEVYEHSTGFRIGDYPPVVMTRLLASHVRTSRGAGPVGTEPQVLMPAWAAAPVEWRALASQHGERFEEAVAGFDDAARLYVDHDARSQARCLWAAARAHQLSGEDATDRLLAAEAFAERHGYRALLRRIHPLMRREGISRSAPTGRAAAGLTSREHEVLERVSRGRTSAQIATELGISRDTVDDLVRSAMRRLGVSNRREAVARLRASTTADRSS